MVPAPVGARWTSAGSADQGSLPLPSVSGTDGGRTASSSTPAPERSGTFAGSTVPDSLPLPESSGTAAGSREALSVPVAIGEALRLVRPEPSPLAEITPDAMEMPAPDV